MIQLTEKCKSILSPLLLLVLALAEPHNAFMVYPTCGSGEYRPGSAFERNLQVVLNSLVRNVGLTGYNVSTSGEDGDKVYGLAQCRGDMTTSACGGCIEDAREALLQRCHNFSANIYLDGCFILYQTYDFHSQLMEIYSLHGLVCNNTNNTNSTAARSFDWSIASLLTQLVDITVASNVGYGTLSANGVYALAQCWREISMDNCRLCLNAAYTKLTNCPQGSPAEWILYKNCIIRFDKYKFYGDSVLQYNGSSLQSRKGKGRHVGEIVGLTIATPVIVMLLVVMVWKARVIRRGCIKKKFPPNPGLYKSSLGDSTAISKSKLNYKFQTLQIATKNFDQANKLGQGAFGSVYKGILTEGREIAVKRLFANKEQGVKEFFNEVDLVSRVQHKNLVKLLGCSVDGPDRLLVYEYIPNQSLDKFLFGNENMKKLLDWAKRFDIILGIAAGMTYLHEESEIRIIHRDIKASNILLDQHFKPKIADFGLARYFAEDRSHLSTGIAGTLGYVAPDYVVHGQLTEKVDVYSFGVLVLEIISGRRNHSTMHCDDTSQSLLTEVWNHYLSHRLSDIIDHNIEENYHNEVAQVTHIALLCTQASATLRPSMSTVITLLTTTSNNINLPPLTQPPFINVNYSASPSQLNIVDKNHNTSGYPESKSASPSSLPFECHSTPSQQAEVI